MPIGADAINPVNGERIPIFVADYVLGSYGTGAIMAVPAHDERDFAFATQFGLPIVRVIMPRDGDPDEALTEAFVDKAVGRGARPMTASTAALEDIALINKGTDAARELVMVNSGPWDGKPGDRGVARDRRGARGAGQGQRRGHLPPARLAGQPPALLGHADPGHPLPDRRRRAGARGGPAGPAARHRRLPGQRREPAQPRRGVPERRRARGAAGRRSARPTRWTRSSTRRGTGSATCRRTRPTGRSTPRWSASGRRSTSTPAAPSTR